MSAATAPVRVGEILAGKYRVDWVIGSGAMGVVVAATHLQLQQLVALKFMLRDALGDQHAVRRFTREAQAAARLRSQHVARVIDVGTLDDGAPFIVMEYLQGADVSTLLRQRGRLGVEEAVTIVLQTCEAVGEAHAAGIVHRDLKPANLFLTSGPSGLPLVKVLDFGISKGIEDVALTNTGMILGSPAYMSPEQMRSARDVDGRTDLWSLGVVLYELLCGVRPFDADTITALCLKVTIDPPTPLPPGLVPPPLESVIGRCLAKDPAARFVSVAALAEALAPFGPSRDRPTIPNVTAEHVTGLLTAVTPPTSGARRGLVVAGVAVLVLGGLGLFRLVRTRDPVPAPEPVPAGIQVPAPTIAPAPSVTPLPVAAAAPDAGAIADATPPPPPAPDAAVRAPARPPRPPARPPRPTPSSKPDPMATPE